MPGREAFFLAAALIVVVVVSWNRRLTKEIQERKRLEIELIRMATTDPLTGIHNRKKFMDSANHEFLRFQRYNHQFALLMIDVDHFKMINDTYGHQIGDKVLQAMTQNSRRMLRKTDIFGRVGGEEFAVVLPETDFENAISIAERLRTIHEKTKMEINGSVINVTISIGCALSNERDTSLDMMINRADQALYKAKGSGRNRVHMEKTLLESHFNFK